MISAITVIGSGASTIVYGLNSPKTNLHREHNLQANYGIDSGVNGASYSTFGDKPNFITKTQHGAMLRINLSGPAYTVFAQLASQIHEGSNPSDVHHFLTYLIYNVHPEFAFKIPGWAAAATEIQQNVRDIQNNLPTPGVPSKKMDIISELFNYLGKQTDGNLVNWKNFLDNLIPKPGPETAFVHSFPTDIPPGHYFNDWNYFYQLHGASIYIPIVNYGTATSQDYQIYGQYIKVIPQFSRYNLVGDYTEYPVQSTHEDDGKPVIPVAVAKTQIPFDLSSKGNQAIVSKDILGFYNLPNATPEDLAMVAINAESLPLVIRGFHDVSKITINFNYVTPQTSKVVTYYSTSIYITLEKTSAYLSEAMQ